MSDPTPEASLRLAAFDFDGTVTRRDTLLGFLVHAAGAARTAAAAARHSLDLAKVLADDSTRDSAKERVVGAALRGLTATQLDERGEDYAKRLPSRFRPDVVEQIKWHREEGHELVMVSASLVYYLRPVARELGFAEVIGVELE
ncbi:MAG TPA: HAD-IB family phosphatase, partial [Microthrixaceae bacterium]|nr:HAD-IB family phosphatase [Microthrixaceae bacterium]